VDTIKKLFAPGSFLGVSDTSGYHAYAVVGCHNPSREQFAVKIDSLGGRPTVLSADDVLQLLAGKANDDWYGIYTATGSV
jgi:hypothetical protein